MHVSVIPQVDAILLCTGYLHHYPYLPENLRLKSANLLYPDNLYKGIVWLKGGNNQMLYLASQDQYYTWTMFDVQARWAIKYIIGDIKLPDRAAMEKDVKKWVER